MEAPNPTDSSQTICFPTSKRKPAFLMRNGFCIDFGLHLVPFWHHFGVEMNKKIKKIVSEPASKNNRFFEWFFDRFLDHFGLHFGLFFWIPSLQKSYLSPRMGHLGPSWPFCTHSWSILTDLGSTFGALGPIWEAFLEIWGTIFDTYLGPRTEKTKNEHRNTSIQISTVADTARQRN